MTLYPPTPPPHPQVLPKALRGKLAGVLFDLGISSPQLDDPARGMRPEQSGPLDLRFDIGSGACRSVVKCVAAQMRALHKPAVILELAHALPLLPPSPHFF